MSYTGCMSLPYDYYPAVLYAIGLISQGATKTRACDESNIKIPTFEEYVNRHSELQELLVDAERRGYDAMADALLEIDNHSLYGQSDPKMAKIISDNIKFLLAKKRPKEYGDRVQVDVNITADKAITEALLAGKKRAALPYMELDGSYIDVTPTFEESDEAIMAEILSGV